MQMSIPSGQRFEGVLKDCKCDNGFWIDCKVLRYRNFASSASDESSSTVEVPFTFGNDFFQDADTSVQGNSPAVSTQMHNQADSSYNRSQTTSNPMAAGNMEVSQVAYNNDAAVSLETATPPLETAQQACELVPLDIVFVFDTSKALTQNEDSSSENIVGTVNWNEAQKYFDEALEGLAVGIPFNSRVGLEFYNNRPVTLLPLSWSKNKAARELKNLEPSFNRGSYLGRALNHAKSDFDWRDDATHVVVVISNGRSDDNVLDISTELRYEGYHIFGVGIGAEDDRLLFQITGQRNRLFTTGNYQDLSTALKELQGSACYE
uniref:VWFA domain-containing protein n=1 Tax=Tetraselmis sp. GSL018 TaxID=582737 RepID=A0A061QWI2_9CHLO